MINVLVTGAGALLGQGIIKTIKRSKVKCKIYGTDYFNTAAGLYWVKEGFILPDILSKDVKVSHWLKYIVEILKSKKIDYVFPGLDFEIPIRN